MCPRIMQQIVDIITLPPPPPWASIPRPSFFLVYTFSSKAPPRTIFYLLSLRRRVCVPLSSPFASFLKAKQSHSLLSINNISCLLCHLFKKGIHSLDCISWFIIQSFTPDIYTSSTILCNRCCTLGPISLDQYHLGRERSSILRTASSHLSATQLSTYNPFLGHNARRDYFTTLKKKQPRHDIESACLPPWL